MILKTSRFSLIILAGILLYSCHPVVMSSFSSPRDKRVPVGEILVIGLNHTADLSLSKIGDIEFKSSETNIGCSYEDAVHQFKRVAARNGGNVIKITNIEELNSFFEACLSVKAEIYYVQDLAAFKASSHSSDRKSGDRETETGEAYLYFYRSPIAMDDMMEFDIYLDKEFLCTSKPNWGKKVVVTQTGQHVLWTKTENRSSMPITIRDGESYYISCSIVMSLRNTRPVLKLEDKSVGESAYTKIVGLILTYVGKTSAAL
ncbi:MAG: hypothetical protein JW801_14915 [Bacteroidales bacterium]|nr:hypothetical protein [Bacteroidales bacterium]